jgi:hypothetical protein
MLPYRNNQKHKDLYKIRDEISKATSYVDIFNISNMIDSYMVKYDLKEDSPECKYLNRLMNVQKLLIRRRSTE